MTTMSAFRFDGGRPIIGLALQLESFFSEKGFESSEWIGSTKRGRASSSSIEELFRLNLNVSGLGRRFTATKRNCQFVACLFGNCDDYNLAAEMSVNSETLVHWMTLNLDVLLDPDRLNGAVQDNQEKGKSLLLKGEFAYNVIKDLFNVTRATWAAGVFQKLFYGYNDMGECSETGELSFRFTHDGQH